jgi:hypothetical protein
VCTVIRFELQPQVREILRSLVLISSTIVVIIMKNTLTCTCNPSIQEADLRSGGLLYFTTLEFGINVGQGINIGPGKFAKKNKRRASES